MYNQLAYFFSNQTSKYRGWVNFFRMFFLIGSLWVAAEFMFLARGTVPLYSELNCTKGQLVDLGKARRGSSTMSYLKLYDKNGRYNTFYSSSFAADKINDFNYLESKIIEVCSYRDRIRLTHFDRFVEVIYEGEKLMNSYSRHREYNLKAIHNTKKWIILEIILFSILPAVLIILLLRKQ